MHLKEELEKRGFIKDVSNPELFELYDKGNQSFYCGYDPSANSLQLGNLISIMAAVNLMKKGNTFYLLVGGATGMIGDPGGKDAERNFLDEKTLRKNEKAITQQIQNIVERLKQMTNLDLKCKIVNNYDFIKDTSYLEFLKIVGKYITINQMITKETVKHRIENPDKSISYTEFSYMLLQGFDFCHLYEKEGVKLQIGGSDQWGNLVTGIEIIRKKLDKETYAFTIPLITDSSGKKFGKSEGNAIWLSEEKNSPYFVYQYFLNVDDQSIEKFLKIFTLHDLNKIDEIVTKHSQQPELRYGQKQLASYITKFLFGDKAQQQAEKISEILFGSSDKLEILKNMSDSDITALEKEAGGTQFESDILDLLVNSGLVSSRGEGKKAIQQGAIWLNENKIEDLGYQLSEKDLINGKVGLLRKGKKNFKIITK